MEEILTPSNVAALLKIHIQTVYRLAAEGKLPGSRIGRSWRFKRTDVLDLISKSPRETVKENESWRAGGTSERSGREP